MKCEKCGALNLEDSKFCRECGSALDVEKHRNTVNNLLESAFGAQERGELAEATLAAEAAIAFAPRNATAHSLLGVLHERRGRLAAAVAEFEKVLELAPESSADREKLEELRLKSAQRNVNLAAAKSSRERRTEWVPILLFGIAGALIVAVVVYLGRSTADADAARLSSKPPVHVGSSSPARPDRPPIVTQQPAQPPPQQPPTSTAQTPSAQQQPDQSGINPNTWVAEPLNPQKTNPAGGGGQIPVLPPGGNRQRDIQITMEPQKKDAERSPQMSIEIKPTQGEATQGLNAHQKLREAAAAQRSGDYQTASDKYRTALAVLGDRASGEVWQQLGICRQRLKNTAGAVEAYQQAIKLFEKEIAEGRHVEAAKLGLDVCRQALQSLGAK